MRPLGRLSSGLLTLVVVVLAALAGCSGDDGGGPDRTEGLTPQQILAQSVEAARGVTSHQIDFEGEVAATARQGAELPGGIGPLLREPLPLSGQGTVTAGAASVDVSISLSGIRLQPNLTKVGDGVYLSVLGMDFVLPTTEGSVEGVNPLLLTPSLLGWMTEPVEAGREEVAGGDTVHLTGRIDPGEVIQDLADILGDAAPGAAELERARTQARRALRADGIEVWVGTEDLLPRRIRIDLRLEGRVDALPQISAARLALTLDLSRFGEEVRVTAPPDPRPFDPSDLGILGP